MTDWLLIALLGGFVGLDATAFPQFMFSRPLAAATLTGAVLGRPLEGVVIGLVLESFALVVLPVGAARYPESGTAAVAAVAAYVHLPAPHAGAGGLLLAIAFGLLWERAAGRSVAWARSFNERIVAAGIDADPAAEVERRHLLAMSFDFARAAFVAFAGALVGAVLLRWLAPEWGLSAAQTFGVLGVAASAMLAAVLPLFGGWTEHRASFTLGLVCGAILLLVQ